VGFEADNTVNLVDFLLEETHHVTLVRIRFVPLKDNLQAFAEVRVTQEGGRELDHVVLEVVHVLGVLDFLYVLHPQVGEELALTLVGLVVEARGRGDEVLLLVVVRWVHVLVPDGLLVIRAWSCRLESDSLGVVLRGEVDCSLVSDFVFVSLETVGSDKLAQDSVPLDLVQVLWVL
jgi:hypothetical protein